MKTGSCAQCGAEVMLPDHGQPGRSEACLQCSGDIHACIQCEHFDESAAHACRETQAEPVHDKERANFCTHFVFVGGAGDRDARTNAAKAELEKLFSS